jgi:hypothetical protein
MSRAKNLSDDDVAKIVEILDGWSGPLRWELLIEHIERRLFARYTRQALHKHGRIKDAFASRKDHLASVPDRARKASSSPELELALDRIERLTGENQRLTAENSRLLEQFVRWAYNASTRNLDEAFLSRPLPRVDRDQTAVSRRGKALASLAKKG